MNAGRAPHRHRRTVTAVAVTALGIALLSGCAAASSANIGQTSGAASAPASPARPTGAGDGPAAPEGWEHVHNLALDGSALLIGTHEGLWRQEPGQEPQVLSDDDFDVMGLARDGDRWLASGHPGADMDAPADLGLGESTDGGKTWSAVSLGGTVDFHRLVAAGNTVMGMSASDGKLLRSTDDGKTWQDMGTPQLYDLAIDPTTGTTVVGTTPDGPVRSTDGGKTFSPISGAPLLALVAWDPSGLVGIGVDGQVHVSRDAGDTWTATGKLDGQPTAMAVNAQAIVALVGDTVWQSTDGGIAFTPRLTGVTAH